jgi:hypothetical protein
MTKYQLERAIRLALDQLEGVASQAKDAAVKYGQGEENYPFEVGYLNARITNALSALKETGLMSNKELFA